jgi:ABC-type glutathione transport system ATPase component
MYAGQIVEQGRTADVLSDPHHSYTRQLLSAVPVADPTRRKRYLGGSLDIPKPQLLLKDGQVPLRWNLSALSDYHDVVDETFPRVAADNRPMLHDAGQTAIKGQRSTKVSELS